MTVDFFATQSNYLDHLVPIWHALGSDAERWFVPDGRLASLLRRAGVAQAQIVQGRLSRVAHHGDRVVVAASGGDSSVMRTRPVVLVEHGAGQTYDFDHEAYAGGPGREHVVAFLCPNERVAALNAERYPDAAVELVGSPRLDSLMSTVVRRAAGTVALSFHWACRKSSESAWALPHYKDALPDLVAGLKADGVEVIGAGHPRYASFFCRLWRELGVEHVEDFAEVGARASVYVVDNSSTAWEAAALGVPVVLLNSPTYRRDVDLWPRFWAEARVGTQVDEPDQLAPTVARVLDRGEYAAGHWDSVNAVFPLRDGAAAQRAADAIPR